MKKEVITAKVRAAREKELAEAVTRARKHNSSMEESLRAMKLQMELPVVRKQYVRFSVLQDFRRKYIKPTPWFLRWVRWIQYLFVVHYNRTKLMKYLLNIESQSES